MDHKLINEIIEVKINELTQTKNCHKYDPNTAKDIYDMSKKFMPVHQMARLIGIDKETLKKYYLQEFELGRAEFISAVHNVMADKLLVEKDTSFLCFFFKTQMNWRETSRIEVAGDADNPIVVQHHVDAPPQETREQWEARRKQKIIEVTVNDRLESTNRGTSGGN